MLSDNLRDKLREAMKDPKEAAKIIEKEPQILELLLKSDEEVGKERREKIKYVNMTNQMNQQLQEKAQQLKTTQGTLIGAGILLLFALLDKE